jgi:NADPH2:quinone reductase
VDLLGRGGRLVHFGWSAGEPIQLSPGELAARGVSASSPLGPALQPRLYGLAAQALAAARDGRLVPLVGQHVPLKDAAAAHTAIETRATVGKTVLVP